MASLQKKGDAWYCQFLYGVNGSKKRYTITVGEVPDTEALQWKSRTENLLMRLRQGLLEVPRGVGIADFILHDGKPPIEPDIAVAKETTLHQLRQAYVAAFSNGAIEKNTLYTAGIHLDHLEETYGKTFVLTGLTLAKLQKHVDRRAKKVAPVTIKKEIDTFRSVWNWGLRMHLVGHPFPSAGLVYSKSDEKLPFMTWQEIERRIKTGGDADQLWECLYLQDSQVSELLAYVKKQKLQPWVYPAFVTAAHTGARRSEIIRVRVEDVDLDGAILTVREKKRAKGVRTTRRVPISTTLATALKPLIAKQHGKTNLFGPGENAISPQAMHHALTRALEESKWSPIRGWHVLRHSFISACACRNVDQRFIDEWVGHQTEVQKIRYRHLYPSVQAAALKSVFG